MKKTMMDKWDPMQEAFDNKQFNSYNEGVGRDLTSGSHLQNEGIKLYVQNIPSTLGKRGFYNLFAEYGNVRTCELKFTDKSEIRGCYGFITMDNMLDAETAIRKLNKRKLGQFFLKVSPALTPEEKERRKNFKQNEDMFGSGVYTQRDTFKNPNFRDRDTLESRISQNPETNRTNWNSQTHAGSIGHGKGFHMTDGGDGNHSLLGNFNHNQIMGSQAHVQNCYDNYQGLGRGTFRQQNSAPPSSQSSRVRMCVNCYKGDCEQMCLCCKMYYCSTECQKRDWPRHESICSTIGEMRLHDHNIGSNTYGTHDRYSHGTHDANRDGDGTKYHTNSNSHMKTLDRHIANSYSDTSLLESNDKRSYKEQNNYRSENYMSNDKVVLSQIARNVHSARSDQMRSNYNTHLESHNSYNDNVLLSQGLDETSHFQNAAKFLNNRSNTRENIQRHTEAHKQNSGTTDSTFRVNKFQNNKFEENNKSAAKKSPQEKTANSKQNNQFNNQSNNGQTKANKTFKDRNTNENKGSPKNQNQINKESNSSPSQSNKEPVKDTIMPNKKEVPQQDKSQLPSVLELSLAVKISELCYLTYFENPYKFWISLKQFLEDFSENAMLMEKEIPKMPTDQHVECKVEEIYGVVYMGEWCRVKVESIKEEDVTVFYIDYGNQSVVKKADLRPLTKDMMELPAQAVCCSVSTIKPKGSESWSMAACKTVKDWLGDPMTSFLQFEILAKKGSVHFINISHKNKSMRELLLSEGFAEAIDYEPSPFANVKAIGNTEPPRCMAQSLPSIMDEKKVGDKISVVLSDFSSTKKFFVLDSSSDKLLNEMTSLLQNDNTDEAVSYKPIQGELVASKFSKNGQWYRAEIMSINGDNCVVFFVDYGNTEIQTLKSIRPLTNQRLLQVPKQALICSLFPAQSLSDYSMDIVDKEFHKLLVSSINSEGCYILQVKENRKDNLVVDLLSSSGACLSDALIQRLSELLSPSQQQKSPVSEGKTATKPKGLMSLFSASETSSQATRRGITSAGLETDTPQPPSPPTPMLSELSFENPPEKDFDAIISYRKDLGDFCCLRTEDLLELNTLSCKLKEDSVKFNGDSPIVPQVNGVYASLYLGDWYRCVVEKVKAPNVHIRYIDYGNSEEILIDQLRPLSPARILLPVRIIKCKLYGVCPVQEDWNCPEMKEYMDILEQRKVRVVIETNVEDKYLVSLFVVHGSDKVNVAEDLVDMGIAKLDKVVSPQKKETRLNLPYPHGSHHQPPQLDNKSDNEDEELEIQRKIQELQLQLSLSQQKKMQKH